jgi:hypothetical protein
MLKQKRYLNGWNEPVAGTRDMTSSPPTIKILVIKENEQTLKYLYDLYPWYPIFKFKGYEPLDFDEIIVSKSKVGEDLREKKLESIFTFSITLLYGSSNAGKSTAVHSTLMSIAKKVLSRNQFFMVRCI